MKVRITKVPDKSLNARKWKHEDGGFLNLFEDGGPEGSGYLWNPPVGPTEAEKFTKVPFETPRNARGKIIGFDNISEDIQSGASRLYDKPLPGTTYYVNNDTGDVFEKVNNTYELNLDGYSEIPYSEVRKRLPKRDYIGGDTTSVRLEAMKRIPGFAEKIYERAAAYGVDPNLIFHRFMKEGFADQMVRFYNTSNASDQKSYWDNAWNEQYAGYGALGLDYIGDELNAGKYSLLDPSASWTEGHWDDNEGGGKRSGVSANPDNLASAIELMAAAIKYRKALVQKMYPGNDANVYTNAAFNMGVNHPKLKDAAYVTSNYVYPDYYSRYGLKKGLGGIIERLRNVYGDNESVKAAILRAKNVKK